MAYRHSYKKRCMGNYAASKPTYTGTKQTTRDYSPCHFYPEYHKICSQSKQAEIESDNGHSTKIK